MSGPGGTGTTTPPVVGGAPFVEAWVDPYMGSDAAGAVGCPDMPYRTIQAAIWAVWGSAWIETPGLVHANPGIYGPASVGGNGEVFPIEMEDYVHVQGVGAKRCIIRGDGTQTTEVRYPVGGPAGVDGVTLDKEVLVSFIWSYDGEDEAMIDGFTFQGGDVQVYDVREAPLGGRVSNCVFDMLHMSDADVPGPDFGVLMVSEYDWNAGGYKENLMHILNNTFIQGWMSPTGEITAKPEAVGICDVNYPFSEYAPWGNDPNPELRGVGSPNVQNNLFRYAETARTPMIGLDLTDVTVSVGSATGPSNAFDPSLPGTVPGERDITGLFCSRVIGGPLPAPAVNPIPGAGGTDPAFVGELLSSAYGQGMSVSRDWRILPDSILVDAGIGPDSYGTLTAGNGRTYDEPSLAPESSFDFDGEVYGNVRIAGDAPDIGFDETSRMIHIGGYGNDTRTYGLGCPIGCGTTPGQMVRGMIFPNPGTYTLVRTRTRMGPTGYTGPFINPGGFYWAYSTQFGTLVPPFFFPVYGWVWIQFPPNFIRPTITFDQPVVGAPVNAVSGYSPPTDPGSWHSFGLAVEAASLLNLPGYCIYLNEQALFTPDGGEAMLTNLQCAYNGWMP